MDGYNQAGHLTEDDLAAYADWLTHTKSEPSESIRDHVANCQHCRSEVMEIADIVRETERLGAMPPANRSARIGRPGWNTIFRIAASVAAVFVLALLIQKFWPDHKTKPPMAERVDSSETGPADSLQQQDIQQVPVERGEVPPSVQALSDTIRYAQNFEPNPMYESLIGAVFRAAHDPKLRSPEIGHIVEPGDTLEFIWNHDPEEKFALRVLTNRDEKVAMLIPEQPGRLTWIVPVRPGLYYWKFEGAERLYNIGKIRVLKDR